MEGRKNLEMQGLRLEPHIRPILENTPAWQSKKRRILQIQRSHVIPETQNTKFQSFVRIMKKNINIANK